MTIDDELAELEAKRAVICKEVERLSNQAGKLYDAISRLKDKIFERELAKTGEDNWSLLLKEQNSMIAYRALDKALGKYEMSSSGYRPATMQRVVQISLYKYHLESAAKLQKTLEGLEKVLPHVKPIGEWKIIGILESTLSQHGVFNLYVGEKTCELRKTVYGSEHTVFKAGSLLEALEYIQKHHPYDNDDEE